MFSIYFSLSIAKLYIAYLPPLVAALITQFILRSFFNIRKLCPIWVFVKPVSARSSFLVFGVLRQESTRLSLASALGLPLPSNLFDSFVGCIGQLHVGIRTVLITRFSSSCKVGFLHSVHTVYKLMRVSH